MFLGEKLKNIREERKISQEELALRLHVPVGCLKDVEQGKRSVDRDLLNKISEVLEVSENYFVGDKQQERTITEQVNQLSSSVGRKIRQIREERGITLVDFGKMAGISYTHISEIERGNTCPSLKTIGKLASVLNVPVNYFFSEDEPEIGKPAPQRDDDEKLSEIIDKYTICSPEEMEFARKLMELIQQSKVELNSNQDPLIKKINDILKDMSSQEKMAVLDYASFLKNKHDKV